MNRVFLMTLVFLFQGTASHSQPSGGTIGVYADSLGLFQDITMPPFTATEFYVLAAPDTAATGGGMTAASFRVKYLPPPELFIVATPNPSSHVASSTPFTDESLPGPRGGAVIVWEAGNCAGPGTTGMVLLYTVSGFATGSVSDVLLEVDRFDQPNEPPTPEILTCVVDGQLMSLPVDGLQAIINGSTVSIEDNAWGAVKRLYR